MIPTPLRWSEFEAGRGTIKKLVLCGLDAITVMPSTDGKGYTWTWQWEVESGFETEDGAKADAIRAVRNILLGEAQRLGEVEK